MYYDNPEHNAVSRVYEKHIIIIIYESVFFFCSQSLSTSRHYITGIFFIIIYFFFFFFLVTIIIKVYTILVSEFPPYYGRAASVREQSETIISRFPSPIHRLERRPPFCCRWDAELNASVYMTGAQSPITYSSADENGCV